MIHTQDDFDSLVAQMEAWKEVVARAEVWAHWWLNRPYPETSERVQLLRIAERDLAAAVAKMTEIESRG